MSSNERSQVLLDSDENLRLSIGKDTSVETIDNTKSNWLNILENILLRLIGSPHTVEGKTLPLICSGIEASQLSFAEGLDNSLAALLDFVDAHWSNTAEYLNISLQGKHLGQQLVVVVTLRVELLC